MTLLLIGEASTALEAALVVAGMRHPAIFVVRKSSRGYVHGCVAMLPRDVPVPDVVIDHIGQKLTLTVAGQRRLTIHDATLDALPRAASALLAYAPVLLNPDIV